MTRGVQISVFGLSNALAFLGWQKLIIPDWGWVAIIFGSIIVSLLIGIVTRAYTLEKEREPKITISDPIETTLPKSGTDQLTRYVSVEVENMSFDQIQNCIVKEMRFTNAQGITAEVMGRLFRVSRERYADADNHEYTQRFNLNGKGDKERIDIAELDERQDNTRVIMTYATTKTSKTLNSIPRQLFPHVLTIQVSASNLRVPVKKTFRLLIDLNGHLKMETKF